MGLLNLEISQPHSSPQIARSRDGEGRASERAMNRAGISLTTNGEDACSDDDDDEEDDDDGGVRSWRGKSRVAIAQFTPCKVDTL